MQISKEMPLKTTLGFILSLLLVVASGVGAYYSVLNRLDHIDLVNDRQDRDLQRILDLDLDSRLTQMQTDLDWIKSQYK